MKHYYSELEVFEEMKKYEGKTLGEIDLHSSESYKKAYVGHLIEESIFEYGPNIKSEPDIGNLDLEIKSTPVKMINSRYVSKERLVLNKINYCNENWLNFKQSSFWKKNKKMLIVFYEFFKDKPKEDYKIVKSIIYKYPEDDLKIIRNDWEIISEKVRNGLAHEISEKDTTYLAACTKGVNSNSIQRQPFSSLPAKQRAYSLKSSYMTTVFNDYVINNKKNEKIINNSKIIRNHFSLENYIDEKFKPFYGMSKSELINELSINFKTEPKSILAHIIKKILGVKSSIENIEEFKKSGIEPKTIRVESNKTIKEHMSFPAFKFSEIINESWEESELYNLVVNRKFLFIIFSFDDSINEYILSNILFWTLSDSEIEECKKVWEKTKNIIINGVELREVGKKVYNNLPKHKDNLVMHVRAHANDGKDKYKLPDDREMTKQCFWLNKEYILNILINKGIV